MKTTLLLRNSFLTALIMLMLPVLTKAQLSSLEFTSGAGTPSGSGATVTSQTVTFQANINNPVGGSFIPFLPVVTTTFSLSNQQHSLPTSEIATGTGLSFGANINNSATNAGSSSLYDNMNLISTPSSHVRPSRCSVSPALL